MKFSFQGVKPKGNQQIIKKFKVVQSTIFIIIAQETSTRLRSRLQHHFTSCYAHQCNDTRLQQAWWKMDIEVSKSPHQIVKALPNLSFKCMWLHKNVQLKNPSRGISSDNKFSEQANSGIQGCSKNACGIRFMRFYWLCPQGRDYVSVYELLQNFVTWSTVDFQNFSRAITG